MPWMCQRNCLYFYPMPLAPHPTGNGEFSVPHSVIGIFLCAYVETPPLFCSSPCRSPTSSLNSEFQAGTTWGAARQTFSLGYPSFRYDENP